jgi:3-dehydroquinate dehydratase-2
MSSILILNGPNLNLLGKREPVHYGSLTLEEITQKLKEQGHNLGIEIRSFQSNHEGELIDTLQEAAEWANGVIFNPGGYSHTSVALRDAVADLRLPTIEVHLSNIYAREEFRHQSLIAPVCIGSIVGLGWRSYSAALSALAGLLEENH